MASGQVEFGVSGAIQAMVEWSSSSNGSVANSSNVTATIYCRRVDGYTTTGQSWSGYVRVGSAQSDIDFGSSVSVSDDWVEMTSVTTTIGHNNNGTGSVTISGSVSGPSGTSQSGSTSSGSFTATLDTIPRASSIDSFTTNTNYLDSTLTVKYTPKATFNHKLRVSIPGVTAIKTIDLGSQTAGQKTATTTFTSAELSTIYGRIGGSNDHCTIGCVIETYNGTTKIGESSELTKVLYIPESIKPSISSISISEAVSGLAAKFGAYIQSKSKLSISISAAGAQGSSIKSYYATVNGQAFSSSSFTTDFLATSGTNTLTVTVTDTRGRTASTTRSITVLRIY